MDRKTTLIAIAIVTIVLLGFLVTYNTEFFATGTVCTTGHWCPIAASVGDVFLCPGGTYGSSSQLTTPACSGQCKPGCICPEGSTKECPKPCTAGFYCVKGTGSLETKPIICPKGYYCLEGSAIPTPCPAGVFCDVGTSAIPVEQTTAGSSVGAGAGAASATSAASAALTTL